MVMYGCITIQRCMGLYCCMAPGGRRDEACRVYGAIQLYGALYCPPCCIAAIQHGAPYGGARDETKTLAAMLATLPWPLARPLKGTERSASTYSKAPSR